MVKDGYYLFIYSEIDPLLNVLGHSLRHDHNIAVFLKREDRIDLVCHLEFERFSGIKHHNIAFYNKEEAKDYLNELLSPYQLNIQNFAGVFGLPGLEVEDNDLSYSSLNDVENISYHSVSHLFNSLILDTDKFYSNDIIALAFDGGPDSLIDKNVSGKYLFCGAVSRKGKIEYFPISSPGGYWLYMSNYFKKPEGTLMALAYATDARSLETFEPLQEYYRSTDKPHLVVGIDQIIERIMSYTEQDHGKLYINHDNRFSEEEIKVSMIMKVIQELSIKSVFSQLDSIIQRYSLSVNDTIIALSGGYALNCPTNTRIMEKYGFKEQFIAPCVNDGGLSIGMGLFFFYKYCERFKFKFDHAYYGYSDESDLDLALSQYSDYVEQIESGLERVAEDIEAEPVVWIDGRAETGPRALGHRSILANPLKVSHKDLLNRYKQREWWRPVAPIILESDLDDWFQNSFPSPYMLNNFDVKPEKSLKIPAVLHLDGSARVQSLSLVDDVNIFAVISKFKQLTGVPMICNTSLNDKGEPIINKLEQAINFALRKNIRIIYAYGNRISLKNHASYEKKTYLKRKEECFIKHAKEKELLRSKANPHGLSEIDFLLYLYSPNLRRYDITKKENAEKVKKILRKLKGSNKDLRIFEYWASII